MDVTPLSLFERLRGGPSESDWRRLHDLYRPLIRGVIGRAADLRDEQDDIAQEVLAVVVRDVPRFERQRDGSFRRWLRLVVVNRLRECVRDRKKRPVVGLGGEDQTDHVLARLEDPHGDLAADWDAEHDRQVLARLFTLVKADFEPRTWDAFRAVVLNGRPADEVAAEIGITAGAVLRSNARVLRRLRLEARDLID